MCANNVCLFVSKTGPGHIVMCVRPSLRPDRARLSCVPCCSYLCSLLVVASPFLVSDFFISAMSKNKPNARQRRNNRTDSLKRGFSAHPRPHIIGLGPRPRLKTWSKTNPYVLMEVVKETTSDEDCESTVVKTEAADTDIKEEWPDIKEELPSTEMVQLSHNMAAFLRHTAHSEKLLGEEDWMQLSIALCRLNCIEHCTEEDVLQVVKLSDRLISPDGEVKQQRARFELYISGSTSWIRAVDGEFYRQRAARVHHRALSVIGFSQRQTSLKF